MCEVGLGTPTLGRDPVKVAVPLVGSDRIALWVEPDALPDNAADLVEWRTDCLMPFPNTEMPLVFARELKQSLGFPPLPITFRSLPGGGRLSLDAATYREFQLWPAKEQLPDLSDVELFSGLPDPAAHIAVLQREYIPIIASRHLFDGTSAPQVMRETSQRMQDCSADTLGFAVMTETAEDLLSFLQLSAAQ